MGMERGKPPQVARTEIQYYDRQGLATPNQINAVKRKTTDYDEYSNVIRTFIELCNYGFNRTQ